MVNVNERLIMKYTLNDKFIKSQNTLESPLTQALLDYDDLLPVMLGQVYSEVNMSYWSMPRDVCRSVNELHGRGWSHQIRLDDSEDFDKWQDDLTKLLLDKTGLPIFIKK